MEFYQELLLTAIFSVLIAFLIGKIAVIGNGDQEPSPATSVPSDLPASPKKSEEDPLDTYSLPKEECGSREYVAVTDDFRVEVEVPDVIEICKEEEEEREVERAEVESEESIDEGLLLHWEDEWEGIEKSELEKRFSVATEYVVSSSGAVAVAGLSSDVQMELYGLFKIATEGRCYESQPLPLSFSARTKWQAWQRLGNMAPEVAMEHYLNLLSKYIPGWVEVKSGEHVKRARGNDSPIAGLSDSGCPDLGLSSQGHLFSEKQSKSENLAHTQIDHTSEGSKILGQGIHTQTDHTSEGLKILEQGFAGAFIFNLLSPTRGAFLSIYW